MYKTSALVEDKDSSWGSKFTVGFAVVIQAIWVNSLSIA